jgi:hypothetical protein
MNQLQLRKKTLILESDLNRLTLRGECQNLFAAAERLKLPGLNRKWFLAFAPLAGFLAVRLFRHRGAHVRRWFSVVKWVPSLYLMWHGFKAASQKSKH